MPVVGGNVSLYNEGGEGPIYPTPVVGMVGELPDAGARGPARLRRATATRSRSSPRARWAPSLAGSELAKLRGEPLAGRAARTPTSASCAPLHAAVRQAVRSGALRSAHDVAEGGLAVALAECCIAGGRGADVDRPRGRWPRRGGADLLFGEGPGAFVVSGTPRRCARSARAVDGRSATVGGDALSGLRRRWHELADVRVAELAGTAPRTGSRRGDRRSHC